MASARVRFEGIRAVHASGPPVTGEWENQWPQDLHRLHEKYGSSQHRLVTLGMNAFPDAGLWALARQLGLRIYGELLMPQMGAMIDQLARDGQLGSDLTFNHCGDLPETTWANLKSCGAQINVCPRSDSQYAITGGFSAFQTALDHGLSPGFSIDNEASYGGDMFTEMRIAFHLQRAVAANLATQGNAHAPAPVTVRDVLTCATVNGAACAGMADTVGRLAPGKEADIVMIRADGVDLYPSNNAIGTVVTAADRGSVDTVIVGGVVRKRHGVIVGLDMKSLRETIDESVGYLLAKAGLKPDIFAERY